MKTILKVTLLVFIICLTHCTSIFRKTTDENIYGQKPPGQVPEDYHPDIGFPEGAETDYIVFSPDGTELCFMVEDTSSKEPYDRQDLYYSILEDGRWKTPEIAYFVANQGKGALPQFSPDSRRFCYSYKGDIWTCIKDSDRWSPAVKLPGPVNSEEYECGFSQVTGNRFYFAGNRRPEGKSNQCDIYCTAVNGDVFGPAFNLDAVNTERSECVLAVSPDEKTMVFTRYFNKAGKNAVDLYVSFSTPDSIWTIAQPLDSTFNSPGSNHSPRFSPDGRYFFFNQTNLNDSDPMTKQYWVSASVFNDMRGLVH